MSTLLSVLNIAASFATSITCAITLSIIFGLRRQRRAQLKMIDDAYKGIDAMHETMIARGAGLRKPVMSKEKVDALLATGNEFRAILDLVVYDAVVRNDSVKLTPTSAHNAILVVHIEWMRDRMIYGKIKPIEGAEK